MDIQIYEDLKNYLTEYFANLNLTKDYKADIVEYEPASPKYPIIKFVEIRNLPYEKHRGRLETIANLGYRVDVYAKTTNKTPKSTIARTLAKYCNDFLTGCQRLRQVSWNVVENDGVNGDLYHIIITYSAPYFEQRRKIL